MSIVILKPAVGVGDTGLPLEVGKRKHRVGMTTTLRTFEAGQQEWRQGFGKGAEASVSSGNTLYRAQRLTMHSLGKECECPGFAPV